MKTRSPAEIMMKPNNFPNILYRFTLTAVMLSAIGAGSAAAEENATLVFSHKDWDLTCDNTLTCRAVGYASDGTEKGATVLFTRQAGSGTPVINRVMLAHYDDDQPSETPPPTLLIDAHSAGTLTPAGDEAWQMNDAQTTLFLTALQKDQALAFSVNGQNYEISSAGSSAVLLKMDDAQGRINTPGAILRKGNISESGVKPPIAAPVIIRAPVTDKALRPMTAQESAQIKPAMLQVLNADKEQSCMDEYQVGLGKIAKLNQTSSLVSIPCWRAAYNYGDAYFVISNDMQSPPVMVTDSATDYEQGVLTFAMKGRGLGDCWNSQSWIWDGKSFVPNAMNNTGRCMLIRPGGAWDIPEYVTQVKAS